MALFLEERHVRSGRGRRCGMAPRSKVRGLIVCVEREAGDGGGLVTSEEDEGFAVFFS